MSQRIKLVLVLIFSCFSFVSKSQEITPLASGYSGFVNYGIEFQWYPAGIMPTIEADYAIGSHMTIMGRIGMNIADRQDFSPHHDHEEGNGPGGSLGVRYYLKPGEFGKFYAGLRSDIWSMTINWTNNGPPVEKGSSDILIVQPTLELGYLHRFGDSPWKAGLSLTNGFEINVKTEGEEVAQGLITLVGVRINRTLK